MKSNIKYSVSFQLNAGKKALQYHSISGFLNKTNCLPFHDTQQETWKFCVHVSA